MFFKPIIKWILAFLSLIFLLGSNGYPLALDRLALAGKTDGKTEIVNNNLPLVWRNFPWDSPFGVEISAWLTSDTLLLERARELPVKWVRMNNRISWRALQPNEGDAIQWALLASFEEELRYLRMINAKAIVIVNNYPEWATAKRPSGEPSYCGPMLGEKFGAFANFTSQLVNRYKSSEFGVHIWELGNEPDIDADLGLAIDSEYGCWGDSDDPYYGGEHYGEMLKVVAPVIKAADPNAQVWIGGLLLDSPNTDIPGQGHPELFFQGILQAGVGTDYTYFDMVPYHTYTIYNGNVGDYDMNVASPWYSSGGDIRGKALFLRKLMQPYGVQKPLFVDEVSLTCPEEYFPSLCNPPVEAFLQMQANHLVRVQVRGLSEAVVGFTWYTLNGPGWRNGGLLNNLDDPRPSYDAYRQLAHQLFRANYQSAVDYGVDIEAYAFRRDNQEIHVVWSKLDLPDLNILVPVSKFIEAHDRDGTLIAPVQVGENYQIAVGYAPVYVTRSP